MKKDNNLSAANEINKLTSVSGETLIYNAAILAAALKDLSKIEAEVSSCPHSDKVFEQLSKRRFELQSAIGNLDAALGNLRNAASIQHKERSHN